MGPWINRKRWIETMKTSAIERAGGQKAKAPDKRRNHHRTAERDVPTQSLDHLDLVGRSPAHAGPRQWIDERPADRGRTEEDETE